MKKFNKRDYQLAAAVCLAAGFGSAQAAITPGSLAAAAAGSGELFMLAYNTETTNTFAIDLGVTINAFLNNTSANHAHDSDISGFWDLGSNFNTFINAGSGTGSIMFNLQASNFYTGFTTPPNTSRGSLVSYLDSASAWSPVMTNSAFGSSAYSKISNHADHINTAMVNQGITTSATDYAVNASAIFTNTGNTLGSWTDEGGSTLGIANFSGSATVRNGTNPDQILELLWIHQSASNVFGSNYIIVDKPNGLLSLDLSAGKLAWTVPTAPVPLPAAAWSFLAGLLAILKLQRARTA